MPSRARQHRPNGAQSRQDQRREADKRRGSSTQRLYDARWRRESKRYLIKHPACGMCEADGKLRPATVVDHRIPHRGNRVLFWNRANWQSLCKPHHDSTKQRMEAAARK